MKCIVFEVSSTTYTKGQHSRDQHYREKQETTDVKISTTYTKDQHSRDQHYQEKQETMDVKISTTYTKDQHYREKQETTDVN